jgi:hypothetical protein
MLIEKVAFSPLFALLGDVMPLRMPARHVHRYRRPCAPSQGQSSALHHPLAAFRPIAPTLFQLKIATHRRATKN